MKYELSLFLNKSRFCVLKVAFFLFFTACAQTPKISENDVDFTQKPAFLSEKEHNLLKNGDIVLRRGYGMVSDYIVMTLQEPIPLTHCGILLRTAAADSVISSESDELQGIDGVQKTSLNVFLRDAQPNTIVAVRLKNATKTQTKSIVEIAKYYEKKRIPFDYSFNMHDSSKLYCAELLRYIFKNAVQRDVLNATTMRNSIELLTMQQFYDTTKFEIVLRQ